MWKFLQTDMTTTTTQADGSEQDTWHYKIRALFVVKDSCWNYHIFDSQSFQ